MTNTPQFNLTRLAKEDLLEIGRYTEENWGIKQRNFYLEQIDDAFHLLAKSPNKGKSCNEIKENYHKFTVGKHVIFYRQISTKEILIVRILHAGMDLPSYFET